MHKMNRFLAIAFTCALAACTQVTPPAQTQPKPLATPLTLPHDLLLKPDAPEFQQKAPDLFLVRLDTTKGLIVVEMHRAWGPIGVDRFYNLVRAGYYDGNYFSRVMPGWAQFGINGDPKISQAWRNKTLTDDPIASPQISNAKDTLAFAFSMKDNRTTQHFFNRRDNAATHDHPTDGVPFIPLGKIIQGSEVLAALNGEYGENAGGGIRGGQQGPIFEQGNAWFETNYPRLDQIKTARIAMP